MTREATPDQQVERQFVVISMLGFFRTITGAIIGTGIALFILVYWDSNFLSGLSASAFAVTYMFSPVLMGRLSDKLGRKASLHIATAGTFSLALGYLVIVIMVQLTTAWWLIVLVMVLRACEGVFNGLFWPVLQASVGDASSFIPGADVAVMERWTRKGMNRYNAGWNGGFLAGQLLLALFVSLDVLDACLMLPVLFQLVNVVLAFMVFKNMGGHSRVDRVISDDPPRGNPTPPRTARPVIVLALVFILLYGFAIGSLTTTTTNLFKARGVAAFIGIVEAVRLVMQGVGVSRVELPRKALVVQVLGVIVVLAFIFYVLGFLAGPEVVIPLFLLVFAVAGLFFGIIYSESINIIANNTSSHQRGYFQGMFESFIAIGFFTGPLLAGFLTQAYTYVISYHVTAGVMMVVIVVCLAGRAFSWRLGSSNPVAGGAGSRS